MMSSVIEIGRRCTIRWVWLPLVVVCTAQPGGLEAAHEAEKVVTDGGGIGVTEYTGDKRSEAERRMLQNVESDSTTDHAELEELQGPFTNGREVTKACLSCHNKAGKQFMNSVHWKWEYEHPETGQTLGKKTLINNFCTNARGNEGMCAMCHASYGHEDHNFDYTNQENIDCVVCHDRTGSYYRLPASEGSEACSVMFEDQPPIDLTEVAQNVGMPTRANCGVCHFQGGGGDNVKHGDLSTALIEPDESVDVHMAVDGMNFSCTECHVTEKHITAGSRYSAMATDQEGVGKPGQRRSVASCESCHGNSPHNYQEGLRGIKLNGHTDRVACVTCHIPKFARGGVATMTHWDWREAGRTKNGEGFYLKGYTQGNGEHRKTYKSIKGEFKFGENLEPYYAWFDGQMHYSTIDSKIDPSKPLEINSFNGSFDNQQSRIWPFKRMETFQPYDKGNNTLVYMHLWGDDDSSYWGNYDFQKSITWGMKEFGLPYSGEYGFVKTYSYWPITHMVAPKEEALACSECHSKEGRLKGLGGFYMPGRDNFAWLDRLGYLLVLGALAIVVLHTIMRIVIFQKNKSETGR
jgi:octaheme c-type cytochrome (tetrathionate reductase family)